MLRFELLLSGEEVYINPMKVESVGPTKVATPEIDDPKGSMISFGNGSYYIVKGNAALVSEIIGNELAMLTRRC